MRKIILTALLALGPATLSGCSGGADDGDGSTPPAQFQGDLPGPSGEEEPPTDTPEQPTSSDEGTDEDVDDGATDGPAPVATPETPDEALPLEPEEPPPALGPSPLVPGVKRPEGAESSGFFVRDGRLVDRLGNDFVMRGINNPLAWYRDRDAGALAWTDQIASTGANAVRLVWETTATDTTLLRDAIARSIELGMVPMVELHDVTGGTDIDDPARMARYYAETEDVRQILVDYEDYLLVNIANEWDGATNIYVEAYTRAIEVLRNAGIRHTLVIDSNGYGQNASTVISQGQALLATDPQHNLLFSAHMYQSYQNAQTIRDTLQGAVDAGIPFIVGEFGFQHGSDNTGNPITIPFEVLLEEAQRLGIGYLAWSWTGNSGGVEYLDLTATSGDAGQLSSWGDDVINGPNGIRATSQPASLFVQP